MRCCSASHVKVQVLLCYANHVKVPVLLCKPRDLLRCAELMPPAPTHGAGCNCFEELYAELMQPTPTHGAGCHQKLTKLSVSSDYGRPAPTHGAGNAEARRWRCILSHPWRGCILLTCQGILLWGTTTGIFPAKWGGVTRKCGVRRRGDRRKCGVTAVEFSHRRRIVGQTAASRYSPTLGVAFLAPPNYKSWNITDARTD